MGLNPKSDVKPLEQSSNEWKADAWDSRSEEFYSACYVGGSCRYCKTPIATKMDICDCIGMKTARAKFKQSIGAFLDSYDRQMISNYNPDKFHQQEIEEVPF